MSHDIIYNWLYELIDHISFKQQIWVLALQIYPSMPLHIAHADEVGRGHRNDERPSVRPSGVSVHYLER